MDEFALEKDFDGRMVGMRQIFRKIDSIFVSKILRFIAVHGYLCLSVVVLFNKATFLSEVLFLCNDA